MTSRTLIERLTPGLGGHARLRVVLALPIWVQRLVYRDLDRKIDARSRSIWEQVR